MLYLQYYNNKENNAAVYNERMKGEVYGNICISRLGKAPGSDKWNRIQWEN